MIKQRQARRHPADIPKLDGKPGGRPETQRNMNFPLPSARFALTLLCKIRLRIGNGANGSELSVAPRSPSAGLHLILHIHTPDNA